MGCKNVVRIYKMKILIIGGGVSGTRFVESYVYDNDISLVGRTKNGRAFFLAKKYNLKYYTYDEIINIKNINLFDCIIISVPLEEKMKILKLIYNKKYLKRIIIEKPFSLNIHDMEKTLELLSHNKFEICFPRRFTPKYYMIQKNNLDKYVFIWPVTSSMKTKNYLVHLLPHIIDWILLSFEILVIDNLKIIKVTNNIVIFNLNKHLFEIIFKYDIYAKNITVNNQEYLWPDYIKINRKILNTVLDDKLCVTNYNQIYNNTFILEMILGACNE